MLDEQRPNVAIGRAEENDLVIKGNLISRLHARIEINRNKFVLIDQSTNGTFVQTEGRRGVVRAPRQPADQGRGMIGLGRVPEGESPQTIRFFCEEAELAEPLKPAGAVVDAPRRARFGSISAGARVAVRLAGTRAIVGASPCCHIAASTLSSACSRRVAHVQALEVEVRGPRQIADRPSRSRRALPAQRSRIHASTRRFSP